MRYLSHILHNNLSLSSVSSFYLFGYAPPLKRKFGHTQQKVSSSDQCEKRLLTLRVGPFSWTFNFNAVVGSWRFEGGHHVGLWAITWVPKTIYRHPKPLRHYVYESSYLYINQCSFFFKIWDFLLILVIHNNSFM